MLSVGGAARKSSKAKKGKLQTVLVPKSRYTEEQAVKWIKLQGYKNNGIDETREYYRFRQKPPNNKKEYYTVLLPNFVHLVYTK